MRLAGRWLRAVSLYGVRPGSARAVLLSWPGVLPELWRAADGRAAAHLVDRVFPAVPVRQWVLSLPHRLRYRLAWDHDLCRAVVGACMRAVLGFLRHRAREAGVGDGRGGAVVIVQRFGGAVNLNVHLHALVLDGVFAKDAAGVRFHRHPSLDAADVADVLATVEAHVQRLLARRGLEDADAGGGALDEWAADAPVLPASRRRPSRVGSRSAPEPARGSAGVDIRRRRPRHRGSGAVTRATRASISMLASSSLQASGTASNACAATRCGHPLRTTASS